MSDTAPVLVSAIKMMAEKMGSPVSSSNMRPIILAFVPGIMAFFRPTCKICTTSAFRPVIYFSSLTVTALATESAVIPFGLAPRYEGKTVRSFSSTSITRLPCQADTCSFVPSNERAMASNAVIESEFKVILISLTHFS